MLSELIEKKSKIGSRDSIIYIAYWLSNGVTTIDNMFKCVQGMQNIKTSEVKPILGLFEKMSLISFYDDTISCNSEFSINAIDEATFVNWFLPEYVKFILTSGIVDINEITYSISRNKYILSSTAISPIKHACYRNVLVDFGIIEYCHEGGYIINSILDQAVLSIRDKKTTEEELLDNLDKQRERGKQGEEFVLNYEKSRIDNPSLNCKIERISIIDVSAGFDIVSFNTNESTTLDRFIEVKTFVGKPHFYWSKNEIEKARLMGDAYYIYLVDYTKISQEGYEPRCISNPIKNIIQTTEWMKTSQSFLVELIYVDGYNKQPRLSMHLEDGGSSQEELDSYLKDVDVVNDFVNTAIRLGDDYMHAMETILSRVNDSKNGIYRGCLDTLRNHVDAKKARTEVKIDTFNNNGVFNDGSVQIPLPISPETKLIQ